MLTLSSEGVFSWENLHRYIAFTWWPGHFISNYLKVHFVLIKYMCDSKLQTLRMRYLFQSTGGPISHRNVRSFCVYMIPLWDFVLVWNSRPGTTTGVNSPRGNSRRHDILWCYHVNNCGAMRGNRSELALVWKLPRCHVNTGPWVLHSLMFPRLYLKWNSGIYKIFTLTNNNTIFFIRCFLLV